MSEFCLDYDGFLAVCARLLSSVALEAYGVALVVTVDVDEMFARESVDSTASFEFLQAYRTRVVRFVLCLWIARLGIH